jgi:hypothetical protein
MLPYMHSKSIQYMVTAEGDVVMTLEFYSGLTVLKYHSVRWLF